MNIQTVWMNIKKNEGEQFHTKNGIAFIYKITGNSVQPIPVNGSKIFQISKSVLEESLKLMPLNNTVPLQQFRAPSYIYALLTDKRIV